MLQRIQRRRTKGWEMPPNTISVTRPGKWGNPFKVGDSGLNTMNDVLACYENYVKMHIKSGVLDLSELKGKNLACFCKEGEPCHADILLRLANTSHL